MDSRPLALVVDDNPDMTEMLKFELEDDFEVITASDGNEALKVIENVTPAIILTDLMMPGMDCQGCASQSCGSGAGGDKDNAA